MKNRIYTIVSLFVLAFLFIADRSFGQATPPAAYASDTRVNYIRIWEPQVPITDPAAVMTRPVSEVKQTTQYFDGLGRPLQTVIKQGSPQQKDIVTTNVYDELGREQYQYLPFVSISNDGKFKLNPFQQQATFCTTQYPGETYYYSKTDYEASPLSRINKQMTVGSNWVGSNRGVSTSYEINASNEVRIWNIANGSSLALPVTTKFYDAGQLYRTVLIDEHGKRTIEYKDKTGLVILKKSELTTGAVITSHTGWLCTYYVYDDFNALRFILQPKAVELITNTWTLTQSIADELCFQYAYDERRRKVIEKVPGAAQTWMVYDTRNRLVMHQDANLRTQSKWQVTVYDQLNRQIQTGLFTDANNRVYHASLAGVSSAYPATTAANYELLTETYYDDYSWVTSSGSGLSSKIDSANIKNSAYFFTAYNTAPQYAQEIKQAPLTIGQVTGSKIKILGSTPAQYQHAIIFYDEKSRVVQTQSTNSSGGKDIVTTQYDFAGKPLRSLLQHEKKGANTQTHNILTGYAYDGGGRLVTLGKSVNSVVGGKTISSPAVTIATYSYNELGQLQKKTLGSGLETVSYDYNIRGWMTGMNRKYVAGTENHYFGMELGYDKPGTIAAGTTYSSPQYNGSISGLVWKSAGDGINRKYDYSYDNTSRLSNAAFLQNTSGSTWDKTAMDYSTAMSYDANGNILTMNQQGFKLGTPAAAIDQLKYTYASNGASNKLTQVTDAVNDANTTLGDFHYSGTKGAIDYTYDVNGNLTTDANKKLSVIYNYLNLPTQINVIGKGKIIYTYDANGNRLQKTVTDSTAKPVKITTTKYMAGGIIYADDTLQEIAHEEGRIRLIPQGFVYDYFLKDHLGNVRMVLTSEQQKDVYSAATLESNGKPNPAINDEKQYYSINTANVVDNSIATGIPVYQNNNGFIYNHPDSVQNLNSQKVYKLNSSVTGAKAGLGITLKVMSGDKIDIFAKSYYTGTANSTYNNLLPIDIINALLTTPTSPAAVHGTATAISSNTIGTINPLATFLTRTPTAPQIPKAYINYVLLDEQFKFAGGGTSAVGTAGIVKNHYTDLQNIAVKKNGYIYIYASNESPVNVFFDNMQVVHTRGPILSEEHYYPFGLTMQGISSKAAGKLESRAKYNEGTELERKEFSDGDGLELYATTHRSYDPQLGRFHQADPWAALTEEHSQYAYADNNPILFNDPSGLTEGFPDDPRPDDKTLPNVVVTPNSNQYQYINYPSYMGGGRMVDMHFEGNVSRYVNRMATGEPLVRPTDRQSYLRGLEDGSLAQQAERNRIAQEEEEMFYWIFFTALTGPEDLVVAGSLVSKTPQLLKLFRTASAAKAATRTGASLSSNGVNLSRHLAQLEKYGQAGFKELQNGRFRYYGNITPASTSGEMIGRRVVREWGPAINRTRTWMETIDCAGKIRIVRPETGGTKVHFMFGQSGNFIKKW